MKIRVHLNGWKLVMGYPESLLDGFPGLQFSHCAKTLCESRTWYALLKITQLPTHYSGNEFLKHHA